MAGDAVFADDRAYIIGSHGVGNIMTTKLKFSSQSKQPLDTKEGYQEHVQGYSELCGNAVHCFSNSTYALGLSLRFKLVESTWSTFVPPHGIGFCSKSLSKSCDMSEDVHITQCVLSLVLTASTSWDLIPDRSRCLRTQSTTILVPYRYGGLFSHASAVSRENGKPSSGIRMPIFHPRGDLDARRSRGVSQFSDRNFLLQKRDPGRLDKQRATHPYTGRGLEVAVGEGQRENFRCAGC